jgi:hypothetical protein
MLCCPPCSPPSHRTAERLEWWTLYLLCADDNGVISKEKIRAQYDGSLWYLLAEENEARQAAKKAARNGHHGKQA